ncbi:hypothetical protein GCK32_019772 [Trichostrongylus colubriformis]|uniref:AH domain-containing protein n=1 Tax=Trichostrongylus colubriformis TaxID=6319 RepID=A0AAN8EX53_TRICO
MLRCRQETRQKFVQMRNDVMIKIELLDQKHVRDIAQHLANYASVMKDCLSDCSSLLQHTQNTPIEIDIIQDGKESSMYRDSSPTNDTVEDHRPPRTPTDEPLISMSESDAFASEINLIDIN